MSKKEHIINENHRRAVGIALAGLDEVLCAIESWVDGRDARGVLYFERNDLTPRRREALHRCVTEARSLLVEARDHLGLEAREVRASTAIWSRCCALRDTLSELDAKHMKGYGELAAECAQYLDRLSRRLVAVADRTADTLRKEDP